MKDLSLKPIPAKRQRHLTALALSLPIGGPNSATASLTVAELDTSNKVLAAAREVDITLSGAELAALPAFNNFLNQVEKAVQDKRDAMP